MATPFIDFRPAQVMGDKEVYVCYYVLDPTNDKLKRMRIRCNRIKNPRERTKYATLLCTEINRKLYNGWNPLINEEPTSSKRLSVVEAATDFVRQKEKDLRKDTVRSYRSKLAFFTRWCEKAGISDWLCGRFTNSHAENILDKYGSSGRSAYAYNSMLQFLKSLYRSLVSKGLAACNPFAGFKGKKREVKRRVTIPKQDRKRILNYFQKRGMNEYVAMIRLCFKYLVRPNAVGKVILQEDASGWQTFKYGKLGEVTENIRTFALPFEQQAYTFVMKYTYDSWNRIQNMTYPDGEVVSYGYSLGGMLKSVHGNKGNVAYRYIDSICYNQFELKDSVFYGNGSRVSYEYDSLQRLSRLCSWTACGDTMQKIAYTYDSVSNITEICNTAPMLNTLGGKYKNIYTYDPLYRLTISTGWWTGACNRYYQSTTQYHSNGRISKKNLAASRMLNGIPDSVNYSRYYYYENTNQKNTLTQISSGEWSGSGLISAESEDLQFVWDATGNLTTQQLIGDNQRFLCWDEQNRLQGVKDNGYLSYYQYDANGDRTYKLTGKGELQNISGEWQYYYLLENATLYASPYLVATRQGYTKHYYAESERIASRIGGGNLQGLDHPVVGQEKILLKKDANKTNATEVLEHCLDAIYSESQTDLYKLYDLINSVHSENECYWYHPDHLGSSSWITYSDGSAVQHLHYLPWGEDFVDQRLNSFDGVRYTFSAKERDPETGLSYFGSRYYSSDLSIWLSVDPMSDQYPYQSGYVYCGNNPIKVIDPNGEDEWEFDECGVLKNVIVNNDVDVVHIVNENGARIATSEQFTYGTLFNEEDDAAYENDYFPSLTLFQVSDFESTEAIYKFLADNTSVEWGNVCAEDVERNCLFFIGSNHDESSTNIRKTIFERGYTIDREVHNHPSGNPELSERDHKGAVAAITNNPCVQLYLYVTPLLNLKRYDKETPYWNNEGVLQIPANKR